MISNFNYSPADILEFVYFDKIDLFLITLKSARNKNETIRYQAEESNMFYVWLKSNLVAEGNNDDVN